MGKQKGIELPRFALPTLNSGRVRCPKCDVQIGEQHIVSAGVASARGSAACFTYEFQCPVCRKPGIVKGETRLITRPDWWNQIAEWHGAAPPAPAIAHLARDSQLSRQSMPKIGPMILDISGLESVWIRGGFKGDVGPVYFLYDGEADASSFGVLQLERNHHVRFCNVDKSCWASRLEAIQFAAILEGGSFELNGQAWVKMSIAGIKEITADKVFGVLTDDDVLVTTPEAAKRRKHDSTYSPKSSKRTRRSSRDSGPLDS